MSNIEKESIRLIDKLYKNLYLSKEVLHHGSNNEYDKFNNIKLYMDKLYNIHNKVFELQRHIDYLKECYYNKYVIKRENIKESYYKHKLQVALEKGYGYITLTPKLKRQYQDEIIENQKNSLSIWIDFMFSEEMSTYPFWVKYWAFQGMLKLGAYNQEKENFNKRTKHTTDSFIDLNKYALLKSCDLIIKVLNKEKINNEELETLVDSCSFKKIYSYIIKNIERENNIDGIWIRYDRNSDYNKLLESLRGYNTKWCTTGKGTAIAQLKEGILYIYYTLDKNNEYRIPRIAIRIKGNQIVEIKGIGKYQNLESGLENVVEQKIKELPNNDNYFRKVDDMKKLTYIYKKQKNKENLTREELKFLYEIENKILYFGLKEDPRIKEIIKRRNIKEDISYALDCKKEQVALKQSEINENTVYYRGYLKNSKIIPKIISSYLSLDEENIEGILPTQIIGGCLFLNKLTETKKLILSRIVCGSVYLNNLKQASTLILPSRVDESVYLESLVSVGILVLPLYLGDSLFLNKLTSIKALVLPKFVGSYLHIDFLTNPKGIVFEKEFIGNLSMNGLENAEGLIFPNTFNGTLSLNGIKSAKGLVLPKNFNGNLSMCSLTNIKDLIIPENFIGNLYLGNVIGIERLNIPDTCNVYVNGVNVKQKTLCLKMKQI
ncbi:MAG: hypothetical protein IJY25_00445 [Bacilli bacterium]|nr:hypothetical protein [Bacilli bacterium]